MVVKRRGPIIMESTSHALLPLYDSSNLPIVEDDSDYGEDSSCSSSKSSSVATTPATKQHNSQDESLPPASMWPASSAASSSTVMIRSHAALHCAEAGLSLSRVHVPSTFVFTARKRKSPFYAIVIGFAAVGLFLYSKSHAALSNALVQVEELSEHQQRIYSQMKAAEKDLRTLEGQLVSVEQQREAATNNYDKDGAADGSSSATNEAVMEMLTLQQKLRDGNDRIGSLQQHVQEISQRDAISKYGSGTHRVELELEFPDNEDGPNTLVIELAPLHLMPHSVYTFMEMVSAQLFDGCSFILNAMHVIKAAPLPYDGSSASAKVRAFTRKGLESVAFREYTPEYPHVQYTVGFAADGSPSFYINTQDNTDVHSGDPCFGKIVSGIETVQRLEHSPTKHGIWYRQRIGLKRARLLQ